MSEVNRTMPLYKCHKQVRALKIAAVQHVGIGESTSVIMHFEDQSYTPIQESTKDRPKPDVGWYLVEYEDGYRSFSPAKSFEDGYALAE